MYVAIIIAHAWASMCELSGCFYTGSNACCCKFGFFITMASTLPCGRETLDVTTGKALAVEREATVLVGITVLMVTVLEEGGVHCNSQGDKRKNTMHN